MKRVLIVEDEADLARLYQMAFERRGFQVTAIVDDPALATQGATPDVIILDERLRGQSGTAHLGRIRKAFPAAKIVLATADPAIAESASSWGADLVQRKPFSLFELVANVERQFASES